MKNFIYLLPVFIGLSQFNLAHAQNYKNIIGKTPVIKTLDPSEGGSGVGGGNLYSSIIFWCNESTVVLNEAKDEAIELWGFKNDRIGAIRTFYLGLTNALSSTVDREINFNSSVTYRVISRGINLAQVLGVPQIIEGHSKTNIKEKDLEEIISFFSSYYNFINKTTHHLDKKFFAPYYSQKNCQYNCGSIPTVQTLELENELVKNSTGLVTDWLNSFVKTNSQEVFYTNINTIMFLQGLNYLTNEAAKDLGDSLYKNVFECQIKQMKNLTAKIQLFLNERGTDSTLDAVKTNKFVTQIRSILKNIEMKDCR